MNRKYLLMILTAYILSLPIISLALKEYTIVLMIALYGLIYIGYYYWRFLGAVVTASLSSGIVVIDYFMFGLNELFVYIVVGTSMLINIIFGIKVLVNDVFIDNEDKLSETIDELKDAKKQFRLLTQATQDAILIINERGKITYCNESALNLFGYEKDELINKSWYILVNQHKYYDALLEGLNRFVETSESSGTIKVLEILAADKWGQEIPVEVSVSTVLIKDQWHAVAVIRNISERKKAEENIHSLAFFDQLTGLGNRQLFNQEVDTMIEECKGKYCEFAIILLDINQFKTINDSLGHKFGDSFLIEVANRIKSKFSSGCFVYRLGGDEFALIIPKRDEQIDFEKCAAMVIEEFDRPYDVNGITIFSSVSIGIAIFPADGEDVGSLFRNADTAIHYAKDYGHSKYKFYSANMHEDALQKLALHNDLQLALQREEFSLYYQPQIHLSTNKILALEALIRWNHPEKGLISPLEFIPVAEEAGTIIEIGNWVLRDVCKQIITWQRQGIQPLPVAINISMKEFQNPQFIEVVKDIIKEYDVDPGFLEFEITESIAMFDVEYVIGILNELNDIGIQISIDDFGVGFSSLNILKQLPIAKLKLDRTFIRDISIDEDDIAIVETMVSLAEKLGLALVAEGVETDEQRGLLEQRGCQLIQGYLISPPVPVAAAEKFMSKVS
ncbi:putative bifunctional diguanylate cyclase/phosphodiesterase [Desulfuribacillus alkaliarsenatis]|uniref:Diguanylate cyclase n=1 Tax=Desulfuribacillus alkaliarsenatis TaxID=766136 RepID=A0A1E5G5D5_9FIRM|nr:EAL domain-containing protein [Desulfuribacillus alkaliarsenatis]OEF98400.1 hypothetical protein BHF68_01605 [Desulfuribacillus alkaliarsenatis]